MKKLLALFLSTLLLLPAGCAPSQPESDALRVVVTSYPVYMLTRELLAGTPTTVELLIQDDISCLHDYTLTTRHARALEEADIVVINGAGLEAFMEENLEKGSFTVVDASRQLTLLEWGGHVHDHDDHDHEDGHEHSADETHADHDHEGHADTLDPHGWLDLANYQIMLDTIYLDLQEHLDDEAQAVVENNRTAATKAIEAAQTQLQQEADAFHAAGRTYPLITFHDGFSYFARAYDLDIAFAIEEEAGSEASAKEVEEIVAFIRAANENGTVIPVIFSEVNGSAATANTIARETGVAVAQLDMCMSGDVDATLDQYLERIARNVKTVMGDFE